MKAPWRCYWWEWGWATRLDAPVLGLPFAVWRADHWGVGYTLILVVGPWYIGYRFYGPKEGA